MDQAMPHMDHMDHDTHSAEHSAHSGHMDHHADHSAHSGHMDHHAHHAAMFRRLFWFMLIVAIPTVALDPMFASLIGYPVPTRGPLSWTAPVLGSVMYAWGGRPFLTGAVGEIRERRPGMMLLIALGLTVALLASWGAALHLLGHELDFWWELALLVVIMLLGHWLEMRSLAQSSSALDALAALLPEAAERVDESGHSAPVDPADLAVGDIVIVRPGGSVPADGTVVDGRAQMDESMITGESSTAERGEGDQVVAGTIATDSGLRLRVTATGDETALAGIKRLVAQAQGSSSHAQRLADRAAGWLFWFALGAACVTAVVWVAIGRPDDAVVRTVSVLVIACPHALGLAIPLVVSIATERAAQAGVLIKDRLALESMRTVDTVLFDKTGTLTAGMPAVTDVATVEVEAAQPAFAGGTAGASGALAGRALAGGANSGEAVASRGADLDEAAVLRMAAAAENQSEHPLAAAIVRAAGDRGLDIPIASGFSSQPAVGVSATVEGRNVRVGGPHLLEELGLDPLPQARTWRKSGSTVLHVVADGAIVGALALADAIRPESRQAVDALRALDVEVVMITGDAEPVAKSVAKKLGIARWYSGVRPEDKVTAVADLHDEGHRVAMVGDGVNDAPALAAADVGIAIGAGTDVAIGSAGVILASSDPRGVLSVIRLSKATYRKMLQNLWWAAGYNLIAVPLAAGVLAPLGFVMPMSVGALLMSASTVVVALNAQLLRRLNLEHGKVTAGCLVEHK